MNRIAFGVLTAIFMAVCVGLLVAKQWLAAGSIWFLAGLVAYTMTNWDDFFKKKEAGKRARSVSSFSPLAAFLTGLGGVFSAVVVVVFWWVLIEDEEPEDRQPAERTNLKYFFLAVILVAVPMLFLSLVIPIGLHAAFACWLVPGVIAAGYLLWCVHPTNTLGFNLGATSLVLCTVVAGGIFSLYIAYHVEKDRTKTV